MSVLHAVFVFFLAFLGGRAVLAAENLALRQQLATLQRTSKPPKLRQKDRILWVWLSKLWSDGIRYL